MCPFLVCIPDSVLSLEVGCIIHEQGEDQYITRENIIVLYAIQSTTSTTTMYLACRLKFMTLKTLPRSLGPKSIYCPFSNYTSFA